MKLLKGRLYKCVHPIYSLADRYRKDYIIFSPLEDTIINLTKYNLPNSASMFCNEYEKTILCLFLIGFDGKISRRNPLRTGIYHDCHFEEIDIKERKRIKEMITSENEKFDYNIHTNTLKVKL